ncbi:MAG TPA: hypothetical protein V6D29_17060 [Leptolyngbyaceae cyanobacterium]
MPHDVTQWLAEIRTLQRQLADTQKERDQAYASAANWRKLYETEARQRRTEAEAMRSQLKALEADLASAKNNNSPFNPAALEQDAYGDPKESLESRLQEALRLCQTLTQQLEAEKTAHALTRQTLTTALGDTFDMLKPDQGASALLKVSQFPKTESA